MKNFRQLLLTSTLLTFALHNGVSAMESSKECSQWEKRDQSPEDASFLEAVSNGNVAFIADFLLDPNNTTRLPMIKDLNGNTALHLAAASNNFALVMLIVGSGGKSCLLKVNRKGQRADEIAQKHGFFPITQFLTTQLASTQDKSSIFSNSSPH